MQPDLGNFALVKAQLCASVFNCHIAVVISLQLSDKALAAVYGLVEAKLDLAAEEDRTFRIESSGGWNDITIKDHQISVSDADCPDHTCVKNGVLRYEYLPIICLPHKLIVRFCDGGEN